MIERFFLDRVDAETARTPVGGEYEFVPLAGADETEPTLTVLQAAKTRTQIALQATVIHRMPIPSRHSVV